ncbi:hypothetical protein QWY20_01035 [Alkalimonas sp. MEB108]|uniref:Uncharacterized protein n=1 Tax=Alkalimonas cellulosilytica TaxID=3058395 RepID=A0ABU7J0J9_9GAMM|nr:hypothetical protein [Alkalimonas sp. MEB108]MEE2000021.1 hypothetical protein [Alkalimonas sp. MEB108]
MVKLAEIPPMQYFSLVRAAKLLSIEIDDLAHLLEVGVIWPMVRIEQYQQGAMLVSQQTIDDALDSHKYCLFLPSSGIGVVSNLKLDDCYDELAVSELRPLYLNRLFPFRGDELKEISVYISGYWMASKYYVNFVDGFASSLAVNEVESILLEESEFNFKRAGFEVDIEFPEIQFHNVFLSRENVLKIRDAITKGEVLDSHYVLERGFIQKYSPAPTAVEKQTYKQAAMIKGLISLLPSVEPDLLKSPHKLHTKLDQLFRDAGVSYPVSDGKTLKDWMEKADK